MGTRLIGHALMAAATLSEGAPSGARIDAAQANGVPLPFPQQPVQGISAALDNGDGTYLVLVDNGYGTLENSADFELCLYHVRPDAHTPTAPLPAFDGTATIGNVAPHPVANGGTGRVEILDRITLRDPDLRLPFAITQAYSIGTFPESSDRALTGADLDPESLARAPDGTLWIGDELGPSLFHFSADGELLEPPIPIPYSKRAGAKGKSGGPAFLFSPQNPLFEETAGLRVLNAFAWNGAQYGATSRPVVSPHHLLVVDEDPAVTHPARTTKVPLAPPRASSKLFDIKSFHKAGYAVVPWTVNDIARAKHLLERGADGLISDRPDMLLELARTFDANGDGKAGDLLTADGLIDATRFDAQGHRGARDLRPENTLPAFEAALDYRMTTLELDTGITQDGVAIISHDPWFTREKCRHVRPEDPNAAQALTPGQPGPHPARKDHSTRGWKRTLIRDETAATLQSTLICDALLKDRAQKNDRALSPVAVAFAKAHGLPDAYTPPTLDQLFSFVAFYADWYREGQGKAHPDGTVRAKNAAQVRFNVESKQNPREDKDEHGMVYAERTVDAETFAEVLGKTITDRDMASRVDVQSFAFGTLLMLQISYPQIRPVLLFGDYPRIPLLGIGDGGNMQPMGRLPAHDYSPPTPEHLSPWMPFLPWPYRKTFQGAPPQVAASGGIEAMSLSKDGKSLLLMLEKPRLDAPPSLRQVELYRFDLAQQRFLEAPRYYPLEPKGTGVTALAVIDDTHVAVLERDDSQGTLEGLKRIYRVTLGEPGNLVQKELLIDLMAISDPDGLAPVTPGDVGVGNGQYAFPYITPETLVPAGPNRWLVINDNNYPFSVGRHVGTRQPDDTEWIWLQVNSDP